MQKKLATLFLIFLSTMAWSQLTQEELEQRKIKIQQEIQEK